MKLKALLVLGITSLIVFLIYLGSIDNKVYFLSLGDYLVTNNPNNYAELTKKELIKKNKLEIYVNKFNKDDSRITDLINDINNNKNITIDSKDKTIKNALIKADLILLSIGSNDLFYKLNNDPPLSETLYDNVDELLRDYEKLLVKIREYCKEDIFVTGFYNPYSSEYDEIIHYANESLKIITKKADTIYIDMNKCTNNTKLRTSIYLSNEENKCINDEITYKITSYLFEKS